MNELKELRDNIYHISSEWLDDGDGDEYEHYLNDEQLDTIMQLIETYTTKKELESYKKGIIAGWEESAEGYNYEYSGFPAVSTEEIVTQLSSQLKDIK